MLTPIIRLSGGAAVEAGDGLGLDPALYDFNGDGIEDILVAVGLAMPSLGAPRVPAALEQLIDQDILPGSRPTPPPTFLPPADFVPAFEAPAVAEAPAAVGANPGAEIGSEASYGGPMEGLALRFGEILDLTSDNFLL